MRILEKLSDSWNDLTKDELCQLFARKENGDFYKLNAFKSLRYGLQRYFLEALEVDIINNDSFGASGKDLV